MSHVLPGTSDEAQSAAHEDEPSDTRAEGSSDARAEASSDARASADQAPAGLEERVPAESAATADPRVEDSLSRLGELDSLPLTEQVEVYTDIHRRLAAVLSDPDSQA